MDAPIKTRKEDAVGAKTLVERVVEERGFTTFDEVLDFAAARETLAYDTYMMLARSSAHAWTRKVFEDFAGQKLAHKERLLEAGKKRRLSRTPKNVINLRIADYLTADLEAGGEMDTREAYVFAIKMEKNAYQLYLDLANRSHEEVRRMFLVLAQETAEHKLKLETEYDDYIFAQN